ncbi:MAG: DUF4340 domain-containing protein [Candidatus Cloacimonadaceae bacterium]|nr:DUF4340 domain-containing protein [Candidatus Cloacimonadaceae bacterium]MDP3114507.1 DUF4340 domain-containing protein [Candidatus Cloacimonadaceae bacterium]
MKKRNLLLLIVLAVLIGAFFLLRRQSPTERNYRIFDADSLKIASIEIRDSEDAITMKLIDGKWRITDPIKWDVNTDPLNNFWNTVLNATYSRTEMSEDPDAVSRYKLEADNALQVKVLDTRGKLVAHVYFGNIGNPYDYFRFQGSGKIYQVRQNISLMFNAQLKTWRSPSLLSIAFDKLDKIEIKHPKNSYVLTRKGEDWHFKDKLEEFKIPAYNAAMGKILNVLERLDAYTYHDKDTDRFKALLENPEGDVTLTLTDKSTRRLTFIKSGEEYLMMLDGDESIYYVMSFDTIHRFIRNAAIFRILEWGQELQ